MKKILFILIFFYAYKSYFQTKFGYKLSIGSTGVDYGTYNDILGTKNGLGLSAGIFADIPAGDDFFIQPTVQITKHTATVSYKGSQYKNPNDYSITGTEYAVNVPFNMVFKVSSFQLGLGPQINFAFSSSNSFYNSFKSKFGLNFLAGYSLNEKSSIQVIYSFDFRGNNGITQPSLYFSFMRTFGKQE